MQIQILNKDLEKKYDEFLLRSPQTLLFASNKYRHLLKDLLNEEDVYFLAIDENENIKGALPAFLKKNETSGSVLNSLPFYGSNGAVIEFENNLEVRALLISAFYDFAEKNKCVSTTLISSPLDESQDYYEKNSRFTLKDSRIGQLSPLPKVETNIDEAVMKIIHYKMRNLIRKAQKLEITFCDGNDNEYLDFLISTHQENLAAIGGIAKSEQFFRSIPKHFTYGKDYKIFVAKKDGIMISAMLVFYFNKTVEYYTPVIKAEFRSSQPLSLLIFEAMKDAVAQGFDWWNWGGTWSSQDGVYHFKSQWGTLDKPYYYYTRIYDESILRKSKEYLLEAYPYFFVAPFNKLIS